MFIPLPAIALEILFVIDDRLSEKKIKNETAEMEKKQISSLDLKVSFSHVLKASARGFVFKTVKGLKRRNYFIPAADNDSVLKSMESDLNKLYFEKE